MKREEKVKNICSIWRSSSLYIFLHILALAVLITGIVLKNLEIIILSLVIASTSYFIEGLKEKKRKNEK